MSSKKKTQTKKASVSKKELKSSLSAVRGQLTKTEVKLAKAKDKGERWKKEAAAQRQSAARSGAQVEKLQKKLDQAADAVKPVQTTGPGQARAAASKRRVAKPMAADRVTVPDETWTVVQLRAEARARGLAGMSNKPKAQLLSALS